MFEKAKDLALSKGMQIAINSKISDYGKVQNLKVDSKNDSIELEVMLDGEVEPLFVTVGNYQLTNTGGQHQLKINDVITSRAWINTLASSYLEGKSFEIPEKYVSIIQSIA
ncbi:MAG: hypothetical protein DSZ12_02445 [Sulfurovum sp.]|nr:MAG: hypothetical protein DSZ12_02445 [Sulfurovum sp.]